MTRFSDHCLKIPHLAVYFPHKGQTVLWETIPRVPDATWFYFGMEFLKSSRPLRGAQWQAYNAVAVL
jgi:hypothetical protein